MLFSDHAKVLTSNPYRIRVMLSTMWPNCNSRGKHKIIMRQSN